MANNEHDWTQATVNTIKCLRCGTLDRLGNPESTVCTPVKKSRTSASQVGGTHYEDLAPHEPFDVIDVWQTEWPPQTIFYLANALKYISRIGRKGDVEDMRSDLRKARHYITEALERL